MAYKVKHVEVGLEDWYSTTTFLTIEEAKDFIAEAVRVTADLQGAFTGETYIVDAVTREAVQEVQVP